MKSKKRSYVYLLVILKLILDFLGLQSYQKKFLCVKGAINCLLKYSKRGNFEKKFKKP